MIDQDDNPVDMFFDDLEGCKRCKLCKSIIPEEAIFYNQRHLCRGSVT